MNIQEYLDQLLHHVNISDSHVEIEEDEQYLKIHIQVPVEDAGKMIGNYGETLQALRHLVVTTFSEQLDGKRVVVNVNDYAQKKEEQAKEIGREAAARAIERQTPQYLPAHFTANQRRVVHQELSEMEGIYTRSQGEGESRRLVVFPAGYEGDDQAEEMGEVSAELGEV